MDVCSFLLEQRAQVQQVNRRGMCALFCAVRQGHWQVRHTVHMHTFIYKKGLLHFLSLTPINGRNTNNIYIILPLNNQERIQTKWKKWGKGQRQGFTILPLHYISYHLLVSNALCHFRRFRLFVFKSCYCLPEEMLLMECGTQITVANLESNLVISPVQP